MASPSSPRTHRTTLVRNLGFVGWGVIGLSAVMGVTYGVAANGSLNEAMLVAIISTFFVIAILRLLLVMAWSPQRRVSVGALTIGVVLWGAGSIALNSSDPSAQTSFPAPGEWLFLASYVGMAAFLVLDSGSRRRGRAATAWLDAVILCGGAATLASALLLTPFSEFYPDGGVPLLVALTYPMIDLALALVVIAQAAMAARAWSWRTLSLAIGFVLLAVADSSLVLHLTSGPYAFSITVIVMWAASLMFITDPACSPPPPLTGISRPLPSGFLVASFLLCIALLSARPEGMTGFLIALPAIITLVATGARLAVALRESQAAAEAFHLARTDDLTGLPNRRAALRLVDQLIRDKQPVGFMLLGLDGFKEVNDTLGHSAGDTLLMMVALRVRDSLPSSVSMARIGGDEFAIVAQDDDPLALLELAQGIRRTLLAPARIDGLDLAMSASLGIAISEPQDTRAVDLLRRADIAMFEAKVSRSGALLYSSDRDEFSRERLQMGEELRRALKEGILTLRYQPKVDSLTNQVVGVEALVRWDHPERGTIVPMEFLPVARRTGLMQGLSEAVVEQAVAAAKRWHDSGLALNVAINVAPPELLAGQLMPILYEAIARARIPAHLITVEVTEETFLANPQKAREILLDVRNHGLKISIDDYGTGFSSLAYLRDLPVSELKMDRSFVASVCVDDRSRLIVASTIDMAHALDLMVVAEGVENAPVSAEVLAMGADILQGYHISEPMRGEHVAAWVMAWNNPPAVVHIVHEDARTSADPQVAG